MARKIDELNKELRARIAAGKPNLWSHGSGLCFALNKNGKASWALRYAFNGKRRVMTLGPHSEPLTERALKELEMVALDCRDKIARGIDPLDERREAATPILSGSDTFRDVATSYIETHKTGWKNPVHCQQWENTLEAFVHPVIGSKAPHEIGIEDVLKVLQQPHRRNGKIEPLWQAIPETASRVRMRIETVIAAAKSRGIGSADPATRALWAHHHNPAKWEDGLQHWLGKNGKAGRKHHAAMTYAEAPAFFQLLRTKSDFSAKALALTILCGTRTSETLNATWSEFDLDERTWTIPATRMKAGKEHRIPLSDEAVAIVKGLPRFLKNPFVFPGAKRNRPLSNMAMLEMLRGMKSDVTVHGFRSTFRDWIADTTIHPDAIAEIALAHTIANKVEAAYRRGEAFQRRSILMQQWNDYLLNDQDDYQKKWEKYLAIAAN